MLIQTSASEIGKYGYAHWTHEPVTPDSHKVVLVPQSIADGWETYCSCGEWRAFATFYEIPNRDNLIAALKAAFEEHVALTQSSH